jgi:photosystem II stability/assembly factor-like uncharacterized protein
MPETMTVLVGTVGQGILRSDDAGESRRRLVLAAGLHSDAIVRCLTVVPGTDKVLLHSVDAGETWQPLGAALSA